MLYLKKKAQPEMIEEGEIFVSNINNSIGANSTRIIDTSTRLFEVYFEPNKPELYSYFKGIFKKIP